MRGINLITFMVSLFYCSLIITCSSKNNELDKLSQRQLQLVSSINQEQDTIIFGALGLTVDNNNCIIISDKYDFSVKKFDKNHSLIYVSGKKGEGPGEYKNGPALITYDELHNIYAVADFMTSKIYLLNNDLEYIRTISAPSPVNDLDFEKNGNLIVSLIPQGSLGNAILFYNLDGEKIQSFNPTNLSDDFYFNPFLLEYNSYNNQIMVLFRFRNILQFYDMEGNLVSEYSIDGLPEKAETESFGKGKSLNIPIKSLFVDLISDNSGIVHILLGNYTKKPFRQLLVLSSDGKLLGLENLKYETRFIALDKESNLLALNKSNTEVDKYVFSK